MFQEWSSLLFTVVDLPFMSSLLRNTIGLVLEIPKLLRLLFITITTIVPIFIIFLFTVHRAAIDSHWGGLTNCVYLDILTSLCVYLSVHYERRLSVNTVNRRQREHFCVHTAFWAVHISKTRTQECSLWRLLALKERFQENVFSLPNPTNY